MPLLFIQIENLIFLSDVKNHLWVSVVQNSYNIFILKKQNSLNYPFIIVEYPRVQTFFTKM